MSPPTWCRLMDATRRARRTPNQLYRLAALGIVKSRHDDRGRLEFLIADLERVARTVGKTEAVSAS